MVRSISFFLTVFALAAVPLGAARADVVQEWNNILLDLQSRGNSPSNAPAAGNAVNSNPGTRASAIQWIAVNDATVPWTGANNPYLSVFTPAALPGGYTDLAVKAAVAQASHDAIIATLPSYGFNASQQAAWQQKLDGDLTSSLNAIASSPNADQLAAINAGRSQGAQSAAAVVALRSTDGYNAPPSHTFPVNPQPGEWILPTNTTATTANTPQWAHLTPFALTSTDQFRSPAPPALSSAEYVNAVKTTEAYGYHLNASGSTQLSTGQAADPVNTGFNPVTANPALNLLSPSDVANTQAIAAFWRQNPSNPINEIAHQLANANGYDIGQQITLLEKLNVTLADARIAEWDTKYTYDFWRPYTAITLTANGVPVPGLTTGNADLTADPAWRPYLATPNHPSYGSGHTATGAGLQFLADVFGNQPGVDFIVHSYSLDGTPYGGTTYTFNNLTDPRQANANSRIYGGLHWTFDNQSADVLGGKVANYVFNNSLVAPNAVPEASSLLLAGAGLLGMVVAKRGRLKALLCLS